jgi:hypothetical protein
LEELHDVKNTAQRFAEASVSGETVLFYIREVVGLQKAIDLLDRMIEAYTPKQL